jgi:hypothetical protein
MSLLKLSACHEDIWRSGGIFPRIINLGTELKSICHLRDICGYGKIYNFCKSQEATEDSQEKLLGYLQDLQKKKQRIDKVLFKLSVRVWLQMMSQLFRARS